jgi:hypothetical protein
VVNENERPPPEHLTARQLLENLEKKEFKGAVMDLDFDNVDRSCHPAYIEIEVL